MMVQLKRSRGRDLPDELIIEILLKLPPEIIRKFRSVCRKWRALTSTPNFVGRHLRISVPAILLMENAGWNPQLFLIERCEEEATKVDRPKCIEAGSSWNSFHTCFSSDGLVILRGTFRESNKRGFRSKLNDFIIYNPINQDTVRILTPRLFRDEIYGLFLHPSLKEYCVLWGIIRGKKTEFKMVNLGPQEPQWKEIQACSSVSCRPRLPPVQVNDVLYWTVAACNESRSPSCDEFIMAFNIEKEEFSVMPHPGTTAGCCSETQRQMDLLRLDMHLSLVQFSYKDSYYSNTNIDIWMLTDFAERVWVKRYAINVEFEYSKNPMNRAIAIVNEELLVQWDYRRFYACNLEHGSIREFGRMDYAGCWMALAHYKSLVSLKNCTPEIRSEQTTRRTRARKAK